MGSLGSYYTEQYVHGNREVIAALTTEEANLLYARQLARQYGWWPRVISTMQGLRSLYDHTGRRGEWQRLVEEIVPDFVDPATDGPLTGREEHWRPVTEYRVMLAHQARQWAEVEHLQHLCVEWDRQRAASALAISADALDNSQRHTIRTLAVSLHQLGQMQRELGQPECVTAYQESLNLAEQIGEQTGAAICAFNLGHAYKDIPTLRDLTKTERWYRRSMELCEEHDQLWRGKCFIALGNVARERFREAFTTNQPKTDLLRHLNDAIGFYLQALDLLPANAVDDLAVSHNQIGNTYGDAADIDRALTHWREAIRYAEASDNFYDAGRHRYNVALALRQAGRFSDAAEYARAALRNFETYGDRAAADVQETRDLIAKIEQAISGS